MRVMLQCRVKASAEHPFHCVGNFPVRVKAVEQDMTVSASLVAM